VIIGAGIVGKNACKMAVGAGSDVTVLDISLDSLRAMDDMFGGRIKTLYSTPQAVRSEIRDADLVIGAVLIHGASAPKVIKREYLSLMRPGSVIVDVAVDQGGCVETTRPTYHDDPVFTVDGVIHYCVANMPGAVPRTSTLALTNATLKYGLALADNGAQRLSEADRGFAKGINVYGGACVYDKVAQCLGIKSGKLPF
jgi:alanine dehydrogenase